MTYPLALALVWSLSCNFQIHVFSLNLSPEHRTEMPHPLLDHLKLPRTQSIQKWKYSLLEQFLIRPHCMSGTVNTRGMVPAYSSSSLSISFLPGFLPSPTWKAVFLSHPLLLLFCQSAEPISQVCLPTYSPLCVPSHTALVQWLPNRFFFLIIFKNCDKVT